MESRAGESTIERFTRGLVERAILASYHVLFSSLDAADFQILLFHKFCSIYGLARRDLVGTN